MNSRRGDVPSLMMVLTGGFGVLVVIVFVAGVALNRTAADEPGDRLAVVPTESEQLAVLVARCGDERVRSVEVRVPDGPALWRIESAKGGITRSYVVGEEPPPFGFATVTPVQPLPPGPLEAAVTVDDIGDAERFDPAQLQRGESFRARCGERELGLVSVAFIAGALGVTLAYAVMVRRWLGSRR